MEIEIEMEMREKERREEGVDWMGGREKEDKERERKGESGLGDGARLFSLGWCLHPVLKGPLFVSSRNTTPRLNLLTRVVFPPGTKGFTLFVLGGNTTRD
jgi:hypothetical protein